VVGTYRRTAIKEKKIGKDANNLVFCDLSDPNSVEKACIELQRKSPKWDVLVMCPGMQEPVGSFLDCDFDEWENSVRVNFTSQMRIIRKLLPLRNRNIKLGSSVLLFAGGGTNNAPKNYSAYIVSKIALMKMTELLDAEVSDTRFTIIGPGWVKTKIHKATLRAKGLAGDNYSRTIERFKNNEFTPMNSVLDFCDWVLNSPRSIVGGRNFSIVFDPWKNKCLQDELLKDNDLYKLRRFGNERFLKRRDIKWVSL